MWDMYGQPWVDSSAMTHLGTPRCYDFFLEHRKCWAQADRAEDCLPQRKDFIECVYQVKEERRARDVVEQAAKLREKRQKVQRGRQGQLPELGLVSAVDIPDEPSDYPDKRYPDDAQSRGLGFRGIGKIRSWASEKVNTKSDDKEQPSPKENKKEPEADKSDD